MKKKIYIIIPLIILLVCTINVGEVSADVQINADGTSTGISAVCNSGCCGATENIFKKGGDPVYGLRITLYKGDKKVSTKSLNVWSDPEFVNNLNNKSLNSMFLNSAPLNVSVSEVSASNNKLLNPAFDIGDDAQINYSEKILTEKRFDNENIKFIFKKFREKGLLNGSELIGDNFAEAFKILKKPENDYYLLVEPIFVMNIHASGSNYTYAGSVYEFLTELPKKFNGDNAKWCFGELVYNYSGWTEWYVLDSYITNLYVSKENKLEIEKVSLNGTRATRAQSLLDNWNLGWSKAIVSISDHTVPEPEPSQPEPPKKTCEGELNTLIENNNNNNLTETLSSLFRLYDDYGMNGLLNFKLNHDSGGLELNLDDVVCGNTDCTNDNGLSCDAGFGNSVKNLGCYYNNDNYNKNIDIYEMYCNIYYETGLKLGNEKIHVGGILWKKYFEDQSLNALSVNFECVYKQKNESGCQLGLDANKFEDNLAPKDLSLTINNGVDDIDFESKIVLKESTLNVSSENVSGDVCINYYSGRFDYGYDLESITWYSKGPNGNLFNGTARPGDDSFYFKVGIGIPTSLESLPDDYDANVIFKIDDAKYEFTCPYTLDDKGIFNPPPDDGDSKPTNFNFRIIDTNRPFSGIDGQSTRTIGSNWCLSYYFDTLVHGNLVGDINGDGNVDEYDPIELQKYGVGGSTIDKTKMWFYDVNSDGEVNSLDVLEMKRIMLNKDRNSCQSENNSLVQEFINNSKDSYSTEKPMYTFTLNSSDIKAIRQYNENHSYSDFNLICDTNGDNCKSEFLTSILQGTRLDTTGSAISKPANDSYLCYDMRINNSKNSQFCSNSINNESK